MTNGQNKHNLEEAIHSLEPQDWGEFHDLAVRALEDMLEWLKTSRSHPVWRPMPQDVRRRLDEPLPAHGQSPEAAYEQFNELVRPYCNGNAHPRFWGWVQGSGLPLAMIADMLAAGINPHMAGFDQAPRLVEEQVLRWLSSMMGFPDTASGLMTSGASMANTVALTVARSAKADWDVRREGVRAGSWQLTAYCSEETHSCIQKAMELLGIGSNALRRIPTDAEYRIDLDKLEAELDRDVANGFEPFCIIGNAGTVNTGAIDNLTALARIAKQRGIWFHVDGAFGALASISPKLRERVTGLELADSVAFDLHKWMYLPFESGCVLVKDAVAHARTFAVSPAYLGGDERGIIAGGLPFADRGIELTRGFKALKVWMCLKAYGVETFAAYIERNVEQANYVGHLVRESENLQLLTPISLNIVCFRYAAAALDAGILDSINREIMLQLQETGVAVVSSTMLDGKLALRCAIVNHRSEQSDFDELISAVRSIGDRVSAALTAGKGGFA
ncbi:MAG TPA: pyridoxal-dependent decarboxylase [Clostridia bacterium]|nr:pyridoxal-dependent decarboxylase [Clostridia bacterium]